MKNIERIRKLFADGDVTAATNSEIRRVTGIEPHQQVYQLTARLVEDGFLTFSISGRQKVFYLVQGQEDLPVIDKNSAVSAQLPNSISDTNTQVEKLVRIGFEYVGEWLLENKTVKHHLSKHNSTKKIVYAFATEGRILYIGKSVRSLSQRLNGYSTPGPTQSTNIKNHQNITKLLGEGKRVEIYVFAPSEDEIIYRGIQLNLAAGLEDSLITRPLHSIGMSDLFT